jgi:hypothetical protein
MCLGVRLQVSLDEHDPMQRVRELLVEQVGLVQAGLDRAFNRGGLELLLREAAVIPLAALLALWATPGIRACVGHRESRSGAPLGDQRHTARLGQAVWWPTCPASTRAVNGLDGVSRGRKASSMLLLRITSGVSVTAAVPWV